MARETSCDVSGLEIPDLAELSVECEALERLDVPSKDTSREGDAGAL